MPASLPFPTFVAALTEHLPGWSTRPTDVAAGPGPRPWSAAETGSTPVQTPIKAFELTGPAGEHLVVAQPSGQPHLLIAPARPDATGALAGAPFDTPVSLTTSLDTAPASAAEQVKDILLPLVRQEVLEARARAVAGALAAIRQAAVDWGPSQDSLDDEEEESWEDDGGPYYEEADTARNRVAWPHIEAVILHGQTLITEIKAAPLSEADLPHPLGMDLQLLDVIRGTLAQLEMVRAGWQQVTACMVGTDGNAVADRFIAEELRNELAWPLATVVAEGPLAALSAHLVSLAEAAGPGRRSRSDAARLRSVPATSPRPAPAAPATSSDTTPQQGRSR
ncbi:hypothetical protein [Kitasatospora purpeofusca]|uniref:hypothetical protein n=1 Tax=Kitasatospora purpeofusca TaxID=67352 RepID=UPI00224CBB96|nr:hypothetical protein [Kitasatospora purpeofusca]MCX4758799.1 hypothetical protein [Kitasatospora purpeofusca]WSR30773.1 hypothetical protein OG715_07195 [Kitasatospora purpeofusca]